MKKITMILMVVGGLVLPVVAADPAASPTAETKSRIKIKVPLLQFAHLQTASSDRIDRLGNISSRPWDTTAGITPPPLFADQRAYVGQPNFPLISVGFWPH